MSRRASSGISPIALGGIAVAVVAAFFVGKSMLTKKTETIGGAAKLRVEEVLENANSLRGNEYIIEGKVDEKLRWTSDRGQVVSIQVDSSGHSDYTVVEIPPKFNSLNIEREQRYAFKVKFREGGIAVATAIQRL